MLSKHYYVLDWILVLLPSGLRIRSDPACFPGSGSGFQISLDLDPFCSESLDPETVNNRPDPKPCVLLSPPQIPFPSVLRMKLALKNVEDGL